MSSARACSTPSGTVTMTAQSALPAGRAKAPTRLETEAISAGLGFVPQPVLVATTELSEALVTVRVGVARTPVSPKFESTGPSPRMRSVSMPGPATTKPGIRMLPPVPTWARVEMLMRRGVRGEAMFT